MKGQNTPGIAVAPFRRANLPRSIRVPTRANMSPGCCKSRFCGGVRGDHGEMSIEFQNHRLSVWAGVAFPEHSPHSTRRGM